MQFYIDGKVAEMDLIDFLSSKLGYKVETLDCPDKRAEIFLMITEYEEGFVTGINVSWNKDITIDVERIDLAKGLARYFDKTIATDLPRDHPLGVDPYYWCVVEPDGNVFQVSEDVDLGKAREGLLLDNRTRKPVSS